jgi:hypothetical protein
MCPSPADLELKNLEPPFPRSESARLRAPGQADLELAGSCQKLVELVYAIAGIPLCITV